MGHEQQFKSLGKYKETKSDWACRKELSKPSQVIELWENKEGRRQMWEGEIDAECYEASWVNPVGTKGILTFPGKKEAAWEADGYLSSVSSKKQSWKRPS